jgi:hypothetical protein
VELKHLLNYQSGILMAKTDLDEILNNLPEKWFSNEELKIHINKAFIDHIKVIAEDYDIVVEKEADISRLYELLADDAKTTINEIEQSMYQAAHFVARLAIFSHKFPQLVADFPIHASGQSIFPVKVLARILNVDEAEASIIAQNYWNTKGNENLAPDIN